MRFETIISTMKCNDITSLLKQMAVDTDCIVINQSDNFNIESFFDADKKIKVYTLNERGVGLSRNTGFMRSTADVCIIADDDMVYRQGYLSEIKKAYEKFPDADIICFSLKIIEQSGEKVKQLKSGKLKRTESLKIGTPMITFRRKAIQKSLLSFSLLFGGGSIFGSGEDTLFIQEAYRKRLKIYQYDFIIADIYNDNSSWFKGYNKKFFFDKGALYKAAFPNFYMIMILQFLIRRKNLFSEWKVIDAFKIMLEGATYFEKCKF